MDKAQTNEPAVAPHPTLDQYYGEDNDRRPFVGDLFDKTARHYEWINAIMSLGSGGWYRKDALERAGMKEGMQVIDICVGTGPVARAAQKITGPKGMVLGLDASMGMLGEAAARSKLDLVQAYAETIPAPVESFDFLTMGYALRHVKDLTATFREYRRVLRPGGKVLLLEITRPQSGLSYQVTRFYMKTVLPTLARLRGEGAQTLMKYFWDTIDACVPPETILEALREAGFENVERREMFRSLSEYEAQNPE